MSFRPEPSPRPENGFTKFLKYFSLLMSLVYPALGVFLIVSTQEQIRLDSTVKLGLGLVLIVYGIYRFMRAYNQYFKAPKKRNFGE